MLKKTIVTDLHECGKLWNAFISHRNISDLWEFRICFHRHFHNNPYFLMLEDRKGIAGILPLSYVEELDMFVFFPGEIWKEKTWIERTPVYIRESAFFQELLLSCPERTYLRYIEIDEFMQTQDLEVDEVGYVLYPPNLHFNFDFYRNRFSNKRYKEIKKVIQSFASPNNKFSFNNLEDYDHLVDMSIQHYGSDSYLHDYRFRDGIRDLIHFLHGKGWLRMVSVEIDGKKAAVDIGTLYRGTYTVFLGGTHHDFLGVAKVMNMNHIEFAFRKGLLKADFLCGDFHWKKLWHLDPEPLYKFATPLLESTEEIVKEQLDIPFPFFSQTQHYT